MHGWMLQDVLRVEKLMDGLGEATTVRQDGICTEGHTHANESTDDCSMNADTAMMIKEQWIMSCHTYTCSPQRAYALTPPSVVIQRRAMQSKAALPQLPGYLP